MIEKAMVSLREMLGIVSKPKDVAEMKGGNFMRVRVAVDVTKPLCRGKMITWDQGREGWVSFISKGDPSGEEQQFDPWLRAPQFNLTRKTKTEVVGVVNVDADEAHIKASAKTTSMEVGSNDDAQTRDRHVHGSDTTGPQKQIPNFLVIIRDIDEAINMDPEFSNSNVHNQDSSLAIIGNDQHVGINGDTTEDLGIHTQNLKKVEDNLPT
uniref:Uncharacterized protein n=1 Tax=Quercus lobata TaxID=97700 RepID=A0A7N2MJG7_QUELO